MIGIDTHSHLALHRGLLIITRIIVMELNDDAAAHEVGVIATAMAEMGETGDAG